MCASSPSRPSNSFQPFQWWGSSSDSSSHFYLTKTCDLWHTYVHSIFSQLLHSWHVRPTDGPQILIMGPLRGLNKASRGVREQAAAITVNVQLIRLQLHHWGWARFSWSHVWCKQEYRINNQYNGHVFMQLSRVWKLHAGKCGVWGKSADWEKKQLQRAFPG